MENNQRSRVLTFVANAFRLLTITTTPPSHHRESEWLSTIKGVLPFLESKSGLPFTTNAWPICIGFFVIFCALIFFAWILMKG